MPHVSSIISCTVLLTLSSTTQALQEEQELPDYDIVNQMFKRAAAPPGEGGAAGAAEEEMGSGMCGSGSGSGSGDMMMACDNGLAPIGKSSMILLFIESYRVACFMHIFSCIVATRGGSRNSAGGGGVME